MHVELDKAINLNYNTECAAIVLCQRITHVSGSNPVYIVYVIYGLASLVTM